MHSPASSSSSLTAPSNPPSPLRAPTPDAEPEPVAPKIKIRISRSSAAAEEAAEETRPKRKRGPDADAGPSRPQPPRRESLRHKSAITQEESTSSGEPPAQRPRNKATAKRGGPHSPVAARASSPADPPVQRPRAKPSARRGSHSPVDHATSPARLSSKNGGGKTYGRRGRVAAHEETGAAGSPADETKPPSEETAPSPMLRTSTRQRSSAHTATPPVSAATPEALAAEPAPTVASPVPASPVTKQPASVTEPMEEEQRDSARAKSKPVSIRRRRRIVEDDSEDSLSAPEDMSDKGHGETRKSASQEPVSRPPATQETEIKENTKDRRKKTKKATETEHLTKPNEEMHNSTLSSEGDSRSPSPVKRQPKAKPKPKPIPKKLQAARSSPSISTPTRPSPSGTPNPTQPKRPATAAPRSSLLAATLSKLSQPAAAPEPSAPKEERRAGTWGEEFILIPEQEAQYAASAVQRRHAAADRAKGCLPALNLQEGKDAYLTDAELNGRKRAIHVEGGMGIMTAGKPSEMVRAVIAGKE